MSQHDTTAAQMIYAHALKQVRRELRKARLLSFFTKYHRRMIILKEHEAIILAREPKLGKRKP